MLKNKIILIVEDDPLNMAMESDVLKANGYDIVQSIDGMDVMELARKHSPDLIIMDIMLPNTSGVVHVAMLKADDYLKSIPVIAVTALAMKGDEEKILEAGCDGYIAKPISVPNFLETVAKHIA